jgi:hypothetical protein
MTTNSRKDQNQLPLTPKRTLKNAIKTFLIFLIFLLGLSFMIATGGSGGAGGSGSSGGSVSGSGK